MGVQITVTLPEHVYQRAQRLAELTQNDVADGLVAALDTLPSLVPQIAISAPVESLSNDEIIALTNLQMNAEQDDRLSELLRKQQEEDINEVEKIELQALLRLYEIGTLRTAQALAEAVRRGLREPLTS